MPRVNDPVCGMNIESETAAAQSQYEGRTFYFCSEQCKRQFDADPIRYTDKTPSSTADRAETLERHEPPYTKSGGIVSPKFGAAGSGGAEYERLPEAHDREDRSR
jgi:Cu+-exporting ATPase